MINGLFVSYSCCNIYLKALIRANEPLDPPLEDEGANELSPEGADEL